MANTKQLDYEAMHRTMIASSPTYRRHLHRFGHRWLFPAQAVEVVRVETGTEFPVQILEDMLKAGEVTPNGPYRSIHLADLLQALGY